jgi:galactonate dehydratase
MSLGIHYNVGADLRSYVKNPEVWDILPGGMIKLPEGPGLGIEIDEEQVRAVASETVEAWRSPVFFGGNGEIREW